MIGRGGEGLQGSIFFGGSRPDLSSRLALIGVAFSFLLVLTGCTPETAVPPGGSITTTTALAATTTTTTSVPSGNVSVLLTTGDRSKLLSSEPSVALTAVQPGHTASININAGIEYQVMDGVGAALTDSAATVLSTSLTPSARAELIAQLFGPDGARLNYLRIPLSSTDFSTTDYTYDDVALPGSDPALAHFSIAHDDTYAIPLLQQVKAANGGLRLMGSSWSAPGWMKTGNITTSRKGLIGGTLAPQHVGTYAKYLRRVVTEYAARGLPLDTLTLQNEPAYSPTDYAGMLLSPSQEAELTIATGRELAAVGSSTKLLVHDHNWDLGGRASSVLSDAVASPYIDGTAFHCYGGNPSAQSTIHDAFPLKSVFFTECTGTFSSGDFASNLLWNTNVLLIGATRNWAKSVLLWNLALNETGGPRIGGCSDCRGVVTINSATGTVTKNEEYYALAQFGRGVDPGAKRIDSTQQVGSVRSVAFVNPDYSRVLLVSNDATYTSPFSVRDGAQTFSYALPPRSVATFRWG